MVRNVLMFIDGLGSGGAQKQFSRLACALARRGHHVTVAVYNDQDHFAGEIRDAGIEIVRLAKPWRWSLKPIIGLARLYQRVGADVVIAYLRSPAAKAELARMLFPALRIIVAERSVYPSTPLPPLLRASQRLHGWATFVTVNSNRQRRRMQEEFPSLAERIMTVQNAVALPRERAGIRNSIGRAPKFIALSSLMGYKNSVLLAKAVALLRDEFGILAKISWLGETFEHLENYGTYRETCALIDDLGLKEQWAWLGIRDDVDDVLKAHDCLIHPSRIEGMSNAICEAMALGLPVIAGPIADHEELIKETGAGLLFDAFEAHAIARTMAEFASLDDSVRLAMGDAGRSVIERGFSEDAMVTKYEALIEAAIEGSGKLPVNLFGPSRQLSCAD